MLDLGAWEDVLNLPFPICLSVVLAGLEPAISVQVRVVYRHL